MCGMSLIAPYVSSRWARSILIWWQSRSVIIPKGSLRTVANQPESGLYCGREIAR